MRYDTGEVSPGARASLRELTDSDVDDVVTLAAEGAAPLDVMPRDDEDADEATWTVARRRRYATFLRSRLRPLPDGRQERSYAVIVDGDLVGVARLLPSATGTGDVDAGLWLIRWARGHGIGHAVLGDLIALARDHGGRRLVADTTADNEAAVGVLARGGVQLTAPQDRPGAVEAALDL